MNKAQALQAQATALAPTAYSRKRSQPIIQANVRVKLLVVFFLKAKIGQVGWLKCFYNLQMTVRSKQDRINACQFLVPDQMGKNAHTRPS